MRRVSRTFGTQVYNQFIVIGQQLVLAPVLLHSWGLEKYGAWLLLSAIPAYLAISDFGFTTIAKNEMTIRIARGNRAGAIVTYQSVFLMLIAISLIVALCSLVGINAMSLGDYFQLGPVGEASGKAVLLLLAANFIVIQFMILICAGFRGIDRPATEVAWSATSRLAEIAATAIGALLSGDIVVAAASILASRLAFTTAMYAELRHAAPWLRLGLARASLAELRRLFEPSFSYMAWLAGGVLLLQGPIVVLGMVSSPAVIATYSTTRTLTRLGVAGMNLFNFSLMPEYSSLFGAGQFPQWRRTLKLHALIAAVCILGYLLFMALFGGLLMDLWMNGNIRTTEPLFGLLIAAVAAEMVWSAAFTPIAATNRHVEVSYVFAILAIFAVAAIYLFASAMGIEGVAACVLTAHVLMAAVTLFALRHRVK